MITHEQILIISNQMYKDRWKGPVHYFTEDLARHNEIIYVEGNYSLGKFGLGIFQRKWPVVPFGRLVSLANTFHLCTPPPRLPYRHYSPFLGRLNQHILRSSIQKALQRWNFDHFILWTFLPQSDELVGKFGERLSIYHCVDDWGELLGRAKMGRKDFIDRDENKLAQKVDLTMSTAQSLCERLKSVNTQSFYIPNAANWDLFSKATDDKTPIPGDIEHIRQPIIGFIGSLEKKSDLDLIRYTALQRPNWSIVILGYLGEVPDLYKLEGVQNVHLMGMRKLEELPGYLKAFDVCMIPFKLDGLTRSISPQKMFEYLASGKPIVATKIREAEQFSELIHLASTREEFVEKIEVALKNRDETGRQRRLALAKENTWGKRVEEASRIIESAIHEKSGS